MCGNWLSAYAKPLSGLQLFAALDAVQTADIGYSGMIALCDTTKRVSFFYSDRFVAVARSFLIFAIVG